MWLAAWLLGVALVTSGHSAEANGRFPRGGKLLEDPQNVNHLVLAGTYGLLVTQDRGRNWYHVCEESFAGESSETDPVVALNAERALVTSLFGSLSLSTPAACDFARTLAAAPDQVVPDFTNLPDSPNQFLAAVATLVSTPPSYRLYASSDGGAHWSPLGDPLPPEIELVATLDVAPSDPERIYVSGLGQDGAGVLLRSTDRGASFTVLPLPTDPAIDEVPYIAAVANTDPDVLYLRTDAWIYDPESTTSLANDALLYTDDGGDHVSELLRQPGKLLGFALSPQSSELVLSYGDPVEGGRLTDPTVLGIYYGDVGGSAFEKVLSGSVSCLTWTEHGLYACTDESQLDFALGHTSSPEALFSQGAALTPMLRLSGVRGPLICPACSGGARCRAAWPAVCASWGRGDCPADVAPVDPDECQPESGAGGAGQAGASGERSDEEGGAPSAAAGDAAGGSSGEKPGPSTQGPAGQSDGAPQLRPGGGCGCRLAPRRTAWLPGFPLLVLLVGVARRGCRAG
jgi:hypothetical protein